MASGMGTSGGVSTTFLVCFAFILPLVCVLQDLCNMYAPWPFVGLQPTLPGMSNNVANLASMLKLYSTNLAVFEVG